MINNMKLEGLKLAGSKTEIYVSFLDGCGLNLDEFESIVTRLWGNGNGEPYVLSARHAGKITFKLESHLDFPSVMLLDDHLEEFTLKMLKHFHDCRIFMALDFVFYAEDGRVFVDAAQRHNLEK